MGKFCGGIGAVGRWEYVGGEMGLGGCISLVSLDVIIRLGPNEKKCLNNIGFCRCDCIIVTST